MDLGDELFIIFRLHKHDHHLDIPEDSSAVITKALKIVHAHGGEVLHLDIRMLGEQAEGYKVDKMN